MTAAVLWCLMVCLRSALRRAALALLLCQTATLMIAPTVYALGSAEELECTCAHGDHSICPMHHKRAPGSTRCVLTSTGDSDVAVFSWLLSVGLVPTRGDAVVAEHREISRPIDVTTTSLRSAPPDPPPPRI